MVRISNLVDLTSSAPLPVDLRGFNGVGSGLQAARDDHVHNALSGLAKAADEDRTSTGEITVDSDMNIVIGFNQIYRVKFIIGIDIDPLADLRFSISASGAWVVNMEWHTVDGGESGHITDNTEHLVTGAGEDLLIIEGFVITAGSGSNFRPLWGPQNNVPQSCIWKQGSLMSLVKVGDI